MSKVVMLVGYPASGKGTVAKRFVEQGYVHLNRDAAGGKVIDLVPKMIAAVKAGKNVILDNTFPTAESRQSFISTAVAAKATIHCLVMDTSIEDAQINACARMMQRYGHLLTPQEMKASKDPNMFPIAVLFAYRKAFEPPTLAEGFATVEKERFVRQWPKDFTNKGLFLDFDGTLRETISGAKYCTTASDIRILPGRANVLKKYHKQGYVLLGVSNQSGVAKGDMTHETARELFDVTCRMLGVKIETRFCPHNPAPITCYCRKPCVGLGVNNCRRRTYKNLHISKNSFKIEEGFVYNTSVYFRSQGSMPQKKLRTTMEEKHYKVVRVTDKEFELDNGDVYPIPFELDYTPSVKEFQTMLDNSKKLILDFIDKCQKTD